MDISSSYDFFREAEILTEWIERFWREVEEEFPVDEGILEKIAHIESCVKLTKSVPYINNERRARLELMVRFHDIGRAMQYAQVGAFDDHKMSHSEVGAQLLEKLVITGELPDSALMRAIIAVVRYHGKDVAELDLPEKTLSDVELVTAIDRIENSCISAFRYLRREKRLDVKGYRAAMMRGYPGIADWVIDLEMSTITPEVWGHFQVGKLFDKNELCRTYADYFLFAMMLGIVCLEDKNPQVSELARIYYGMEVNGQTIFDRWRSIIHDFIGSKEVAEEILFIFESRVVDIFRA